MDPGPFLKQKCQQKCLKNNSKSVSFYTLGCKLNFSETSTIAESFRDAGYQEVPFEENSDVCVINTCSVTENADKKFYNILKKIKKFNPQSYVCLLYTSDAADED